MALFHARGLAATPGILRKYQTLGRVLQLHEKLRHGDCWVQEECCWGVLSRHAEATESRCNETRLRTEAQHVRPFSVRLRVLDLAWILAWRSKSPILPPTIQPRLSSGWPLLMKPYVDFILGWGGVWLRVALGSMK